MCKIDVTFCGQHDQDEHVAAMIAGLEDAADFNEEDEDTRGEADMHEMARR